MTEFVDGARKEIEDRLKTLGEEIRRLERAAAALSDGTTRRRPGRPKRSGTRGSAVRTRRRRRGSTRAAQAEKLVRQNPGIAIPDLARRMEIQPTYLYRVMPQLAKEGKVQKHGKEWHPA